MAAMITTSMTSSNAGDVMLKQLVTAGPHEHALHATALLTDFSISGVPVVDNDSKYLGVFSDSSALLAFLLSKEQNVASSCWKKPARDVMARSLVTVGLETSACDAIELMLKHQISGLPVVSNGNRFEGIFSELTTMRVLIDIALHQHPEPSVGAYLDCDEDRLITESTSLDECAARFSESEFRRLPVVSDGRIVGQVSRRDIIRAYMDSMESAASARNRTAWWHALSNFSWRVENVMRTDAPTVESTASWLTMAHNFLTTSARRFPVVDSGHLVGQVSRRDLLEATRHLVPTTRLSPRTTPLYLSSVNAEAVFASG
jgi:CBS domain-containing protein